MSRKRRPLEPEEYVICVGKGVGHSGRLVCNDRFGCPVLGCIRLLPGRMRPLQEVGPRIVGRMVGKGPNLQQVPRGKNIPAPVFVRKNK